MKQHLKDSSPFFALLLLVALLGLGLTLFAKGSISREKVTLESHPTQVP